MSASVPEEVTGFRRACAVAVCLALLLAGAGLAVGAGIPVDAPFAFPALLLLPLYLIASQRPLDFEFRKDSASLTLTHLPLSLGVLVVAPGLHLLMRLGAVLLDSVVLRRLSPMKVAYNAGAAAFEVGVLTAVVGAADPDGPGPVLWIALYLGLLVADVLQNLALQAVWWLLGRRRTRAEVLEPLILLLFTTTVFTGVAVVALSAAWTDPSTIAVTVALVLALGLAYQAYRRQSAREQGTDRLYAFVKSLRPFDVDAPDATGVLDEVRELLHSRRLDLALCSPTGQWRHLLVSDEATRPNGGTQLLDVAQEVASSGAPSLAGRGRSGASQRMATPLLGNDGFMGVLTAEDRLGTVRGFDMGDLRLLEAVGAELATALERGRLLADLERSATTDVLTGLPNLHETTRRLAAMLPTGPGGVVLAAIAVDSFREVNDTLGHEVGDELLLEVAARLQRALPSALVGRIGGGRFAVALPSDVAGGDPEMFGLGVRAQVEGTAQIGPVGTHVRLSVGCVAAPEHGRDAATLLRRAETAMYSARHAHGGPVLWEPAYEVTGQRRLAVVAALREALASGAIGVAFQPKIDAATGAVSGVEALARWTHPALGSIPPDEFIPLAEASGLMGPLTTTVLRQSLTACKGWQRRAGRIGVAVNVCADTLLDPAFVTEVSAVLSSVDIAPDLLTFELTEGVVVSDAALAVVRMSELHALGVKLSVDDFGTGYSSLTYLKGLPVDEVKIDKGFVDALVTDPADRAVVRAVVDIAHTLGLRVVAEGVEQTAQEAILRGLGVDEIQGYLHARPMPALEMGTWLRRREGSARLV